MKKTLLRALGIVAPGLRPLDEWITTYRKILDALPLSKKTMVNRAVCIGHLATALGHRPIGRIRSHEVSALVMSIRETWQFTACRVLIEARTVFAEVVNFGWIDRNPAAAVGIPAARIARNGLALEQWAAIRDYAAKLFPTCVAMNRHPPAGCALAEPVPHAGGEGPKKRWPALLSALCSTTPAPGCF